MAHLRPRTRSPLPARCGHLAISRPAECCPPPQWRRRVSRQERTFSDACKARRGKLNSGNCRPSQPRYNMRLSCCSIPAPIDRYLRSHLGAVDRSHGQQRLTDSLPLLPIALLARSGLLACSFHSCSCTNNVLCNQCIYSKRCEQ